MSNGLECQVFGTQTPLRGVDVWSEDTLARWDRAPPKIYRDFDDKGARVRIEPEHAPYEWSWWWYLTGTIRSCLAAVETRSEMAVSGHELRQALEVAIACELSTQLGSASAGSMHHLGSERP